jgi:minimal PKS ketosynthase (KS/KS alpha)
VTRQVVVTGLGVLTAGSDGTKAFWELLTAGRTATRAITAFDATGYRSRIAAECDFDPVAAGLSPQQVRRLDRAAQFALVAAREATRDSGLDADRLNPERVGVVLGTAQGSSITLDREYCVASDGGRDWLVDHRYASTFMYDAFVPSSMAAEVAWQVGAEGPVSVISTGCTSGLDAPGHGAELIRDGVADVVLAGATEAPITPISVACFDAIKATSPRNGEPATASRPFDATRDGFVLGEGAGVLVLEEAEHARRRGAHVYCEIAGFATRNNAYHMTGLRPDGREMAEAIRAAMAQARLDPSDLRYVNAHGSGTKQNDRHETAAFKAALGPRAYELPVSSIKSMVGHSLGAIGSIEIAACALAIEHGVVPPTANLHTTDPECDLDYVPLTARELPVDAALTVGSGFGGFQSAMVLSRFGDSA